jgi:hypothetical protein
MPMFYALGSSAARVFGVNIDFCEWADRHE